MTTEVGKLDFTVHVQQPTVPHYRLAFFDAVADRLGRRLLVSASRTVGNGPNSVEDRRDYLNLEHPCRTMLGGSLYWQRALIPAAHLGRGDVAVVSGNPRYLSTLRFANMARRRGMGLVWWGHAWSPTSRRWSTKLRTLLMGGMDSILFYTDEEAIAWRPRIPRTIGIFGAQNAIDQCRARAEIVHWTDQRLSGFRSEHGLDGRRVLLFCGRLRPQPPSDVDLLLGALGYLTSIDKSYLAVIIGDGEELPRLQQMSRELGVEAHVRWLGAQHDETVNAPWFLSSLCFVYPGSIGLSLLHAMGYGLPVITHNDRRRHGPEISALRDGQNGLLFDKGNARKLADQISRLAGDPALRSVLATNALVAATSEFSIDKMTDQFCSAVLYARRKSMGLLDSG